ncbi:mitochondrial import inner membrane translocase subunit TIM14-1-like isoform X2 [Cucurbita pepo subsp. pepo]|uniref:Mitochondrial import inner membrane translocase subunit TIM14-1-like isoform X2 n=2 Tax=Cucurbita TaxID=3660 RepID=A0A6J1IRS2_CUCMA|nr:mitochondrial import inner membrane translocase subunit TIM14-1-like isoform X2 [Cucurbita moschata]XP_022978950.1 mitochondrial import inner membrane translocase subunit TIM14-1-like isoform X2 [Cucurbita maxima]XP_023543182.1 mitochondrial import inner membrane translocase subunit TIM14-1-like isoform X2 [Cucurbita pepo subsp. pepo]
MATPLITGIAVAAAAYAGRYGLQAWQAFKARPPTARLRKFYEGGFQPTMTRREAALILGGEHSNRKGERSAQEGDGCKSSRCRWQPLSCFQDQ